MKNLILVAMTFSSINLLAATSAPKIVYGEDNRVEIFEISDHLQEIAASTAGMIKKNDLLSVHKDYKLMPPKVIEKTMRLCKDERFLDQSNAMSCSGFLVGPDLLVTAGHCINSEKDCADSVFVFDYKLREDTKRADVVINNDKIYSCKKILNAALYNTDDGKVRHDYSLIRLDRKVEGRKILKFRTSGKVEDDAQLYVIGHPSGLPSKFAGGASVKFNSHDNYFVTNLDTFGGNSGSAVFNAKTDTIEGILVRGSMDYIKGPSGDCYMVTQVPDDAPEILPSRFGEAVSRITDVPTLFNRGPYFTAIAEGSLDEVKALAQKVAEVNIYDNNLNTALHYAALNKRLDVAKFLVGENAEAVNVNLANDEGQTALFIAAEKNDTKLVEYLLASGADASIKDNKGIFPYQKAPIFSKARRLLKKAIKL